MHDSDEQPYTRLSPGERRMQVDDQIEVVELYKECHPNWPVPKLRWFQSVNSLVFRDLDRVVGWTAFTLSLPPTVDLSQRLGPDAWCAYLIDTCVTTAYRGRGIAGYLMDRRLEIVTDAGCQMAIGAAHRDNGAMIKILATRGFKIVAEARNAFPDGTTGYVYIKTLGG